MRLWLDYLSLFWLFVFLFFFFKQKTAYEMRISDWSSDVCSSDLYVGEVKQEKGFLALPQVAEDLASRMPERSRLVIQFVSVRNAAGRQVLNELKGLAIRLPQIELHHGFWTDEHLHEALAASSVFYMN